jgi:hypothetical protein
MTIKLGDLPAKTGYWLTVFSAPPKVKVRFQFAPRIIMQLV